ncbi:MAG: response regulator [Rhodoferax sp.]
MHTRATDNPASTQDPAPAERTRRVLLVDDDLLQLALLQEYFGGKHGIDVLACDRAEAALQTLRRFGASAFVLVVVDLHMPGMDGFEFMEQLQAQGFRGALAIVSGQSNAVLHSASLVAQLRHFRLIGQWQKPVSRVQLREIWSQV